MRGQAPRFYHLAVLLSVIALIALLVFLIFRMAASHIPLFSGIGIRIAERLMGLLLAAIAVQFVLNAITKIGVLG